MNSGEKLVYSVEEMAKKLNIGKNLAYELVHSDNFPKVIVGRRKILIPCKALDKWIESNSCASNQ